MHPGSSRFHPEIPLEKHWNLMRDGLDQILPLAESCGMTVCIENSMLCATTPSVMVMLKNEYPMDTRRLCNDSSHVHQQDVAQSIPNARIRQYWQQAGLDEPEWDDRALEKTLPQIVSCHLHDNDGSDDSHSLPGEGTINWNKVIPLLKKAPRLQLIRSEVPVIPRDPPFWLCRKFTEPGETV